MTSYELPDGSIDEDGRKVKCATCGTKWLAKPQSVAVVDPVLDSVATGREDPGVSDSWRDGDQMDARRQSKSDPIDADFEEDEGEDMALHMPAVAQKMPRARAINPLMRSSADRLRQGKVNRYEVSEKSREKRSRILRPLSLVATLGLVAGLVYLREPVVRALPDLASLYSFIGFEVNLRGFEIRNVRSERVVEATGPVLIITGEIENVKDVVVPAPKLHFRLKTNTNEEIYNWDYELSVPAIVPGGIAHFQSRLPSPPPLGRNVSVQFAGG